MTYKYLIEKQKDEKTFTNKVKPFLNKNEPYFKAYLLSEDGFHKEMVVGYAYRCSILDFMQDLRDWSLEEVDGFTEFLIYTKKVLEDGTTITIGSELF